ncbi:hypothetical protein JCM24511_01141 [Saitozyma sp. JCM 24511]|nr:hypothetical protein JCM24511_01141 [Saitozyma sp. JCM 24511]
MSCPSDNSADNDGIHWDAHVIGWAVAGGCAALTSLITLFTLTMHATHYQSPAAQKQVMRVLMMPCVYSVISFLSYRYYRTYEYYYLCETAYEAITLSAFLMLLMELVSLNSSDHEIRGVLAEKDKRKLPPARQPAPIPHSRHLILGTSIADHSQLSRNCAFQRVTRAPLTMQFNCWRFRASKPYFMHTLSFSVMQYVVFRPLLSIIGLVCEYFNVLCPQEYSVHFAEVYLDAFDFVSISVALYGLIVFYVLCKDELKGRKPLSKFLAIKLIVFFTFYQSFLFSVLQNYGVIKATQFWTADNVSDGLSALCTTIEMVFFSIYMGWAYNWTDYTNPKINPVQRPTGFKTYCQAIWDTINLTDFVLEIWHALVFFVNYMRGKPGTRGHTTQFQKTFMPPAEDGDQTQMDKLGQNPYLRDKYSTDYNAITGDGAGAGGAPSDSYVRAGAQESARGGGTIFGTET